MDGNRWCGNVGRQHKSNGVMYVVNLATGIFYQKCHDHECRAAHYRSDGRPLPDAICPFAEEGHTDSDGSDGSFAEWADGACGALDQLEGGS